MYGLSTSTPFCLPISFLFQIENTMSSLSSFIFLCKWTVFTAFMVKATDFIYLFLTSYLSVENPGGQIPTLPTNFRSLWVIDKNTSNFMVYHRLAWLEGWLELISTGTCKYSILKHFQYTLYLGLPRQYLCIGI